MKQSKQGIAGAVEEAIKSARKPKCVRNGSVKPIEMDIEKLYEEWRGEGKYPHHNLLLADAKELMKFCIEKERERCASIAKSFEARLTEEKKGYDNLSLFAATKTHQADTARLIGNTIQDKTGLDAWLNLPNPRT